MIQDLLAENRKLKVGLERAKLELADAQGSAGDQDPRIPQLQAELARLRTQLDETRAEVNLLRTERDELRDGIVHAIAELKAKSPE